MLDFLGINVEHYIDWGVILRHLFLIGFALVLTIPVAINREANSHGGGVRTFPLVAVATCSYTLLCLDVIGNEEAIGKFMAGIVTGIGFIGGGAILKSKDDSKVSGLANAASIWNTGAIGMSVAWQRFEIAIIIAVINFLILRIGYNAKKIVKDSGGCEDEQETKPK
ncbi:MgtC/SapB family protein [Marinicella gelatinilytica]|uniref:MgtC/SapB family protein n=1 Tax=Marinicella gelatinilytica TaxID=2996017 RepID=UPI0022609866|nr:MgtC/SapB family protein [Marinicella gelatinilytica]MCX7545055.1 MgtC/SapB family protein [Marinicella gelatinilytica]